MNTSFLLSHCFFCFFLHLYAAVWRQRLLSFTCSIMKNENVRQWQVEVSDLLHTLVQQLYTRGANCGKCQKKLQNLHIVVNVFTCLSNQALSSYCLLGIWPYADYGEDNLLLMWKYLTGNTILIRLILEYCCSCKCGQWFISFFPRFMLASLNVTLSRKQTTPSLFLFFLTTRYPYCLKCR